MRARRSEPKTRTRSKETRVSDTDFAVGSGTDFDPMDVAFASGKPAERKLTEDAVPKGIYVVLFKGGKGALQGDEKIPTARMSATVLEGANDTVGKTIFGPLKERPSRFEYKKSEGGNREQVALTEEKYQEACGKHANMLLRVAQVLEFLSARPSKPVNEDSMTAFATQAIDKKAVIEVNYMPARDDFSASNFFNWDSIATLDEPVEQKRGPAISALQDARNKIEAANKRAEKRAEKKGKTAGGLVAGGPGGF